jgi:hypothetical protein
VKLSRMPPAPVIEQLIAEGYSVGQQGGRWVWRIVTSMITSARAYTEEGDAWGAARYHRNARRSPKI